MATASLFAGVAFLLLRDDGARSESHGASRAAAAPSSRVDLPNGSCTPQTARNRQVFAARFAAADDDPSTAKSPNGRLIEVEVVRAGTQEPIADAEVSWWPVSADFDGGRDFERWLATSALEQQTGESVRLRTDGRGRVRVPDWDRGFVVSASCAGLWGHASVGIERARPIRVVLAGDRDLEVQVVDERGSPVVDAPVALRQDLGDSLVDRLSARTRSPDGIAVLRHVEAFLRRPVEPNPVFLVAVQGLFAEPVERRVDRNRLPEGPIQLILRATGSCEVVVLDGGGQPVAGALQGRLRFADAVADPAPATRTVPASVISARDGRLVFDHVALGRSLVVEVVHDALDGSIEVRGRGPEQPGERVTLQARVGENVAVLRGRMVDRGGAPCADAAAYARLEPADAECQIDGTAGTWSVRTDAEGRFCVLAPPSPEAGEVKLGLYRLSARGDDAVAAARTSLTGGLTAGVHDLGDFVLADVPGLAEGEVVDGEGRPVAAAEVVAAASGSDAGPGVLRRPPRFDPSVTDARGRFEIRGDCGEKSLQLSASKAEMAGTPVLVRTGERGIRLVLGAAGSIEGRLLVDSSLERERIVVEALRPGVPAPAQARGGTLGPDGRTAVAGLPSGTYLLRVTYGAHEIAGLRDLVVQPGKPTRDSRMDPLDLRAACRVLTLEVVDERGVPVPDASGTSRGSNEADAPWTACERSRERIQAVLVSSDGVDVAVGAPGFLDTEIRGVVASRRVVLRRAPLVRVRLADGLRAPESPFVLQVTLCPASKPSGKTATASFDSKGEGTCHPAFSGEAAVQLTLILSEGGAESVARLEATPASISIGTSGAEQELEIRFDPEALAARLRELRAR